MLKPVPVKPSAKRQVSDGAVTPTALWPPSNPFQCIARSTTMLVPLVVSTMVENARRRGRPRDRWGRLHRWLDGCARRPTRCARSRRRRSAECETLTWAAVLPGLAIST